MDRKDVIDAFGFRFACKEFDESREISKDDLHCILEAGRVFPFSFLFGPGEIFFFKRGGV